MPPPVIHELPVDPPINNTLAGDRIEIVGSTLKVWRGPTLIAERTLVLPGTTVESGVIPATRDLTSVFYIEDRKMPGITATNTNVAINETTGTIRFDFSNGDQREFQDLNALKSAVQKYDTDVSIAQDIVILKAIRNSPDGSNLTTMVGQGVSCDFNGTHPIVFSTEI